MTENHQRRTWGRGGARVTWPAACTKPKVLLGNRARRHPSPSRQRLSLGDMAVNSLPRPGVQCKHCRAGGTTAREKWLGSGCFSSGGNVLYQLFNHKPKLCASMQGGRPLRGGTPWRRPRAAGLGPGPQQERVGPCSSGQWGLGRWDPRGAAQRPLLHLEDYTPVWELGLTAAASNSPGWRHTWSLSQRGKHILPFMWVPRDPSSGWNQPPCAGKTLRSSRESRPPAVGRRQPHASQIAAGTSSPACQLQHLKLMDIYYFCLGGKNPSYHEWLLQY